MAAENSHATRWPYWPATPAMPIRDAIAVAALHAWISRYGPNDAHPAWSEHEPDHLARQSYMMADAMLTASREPQDAEGENDDDQP